MSEEDKKLLLEMKSNCLEYRGTSRITYNDEKRIKKAKAIDNALKEIERLNKCIKDDKENADEIIVEQQQEIERLHSIIKEAKDFINGKDLKEKEYRFAEDFDFTKLLEILDREK